VNERVERGAAANGRRFCIVASRFNAKYVDRMVAAARDVLVRSGAAAGDIEVRHVPGAFELPLGCQRAAGEKRFDAILAFGCLIRGETDHYRLIADAATQGLMRVMLDARIPVLHGLLAVHEAAHAEARTGGAVGNRGAEVALAALAMLESDATNGARS
jgi:6,7-dimethyl-8-ribityllumazine synthase